MRLIYKEKADSESYIKYLRSIGMEIGDNCTIFTPRNVLIDTQYPWMTKIGNNVQITQGVSIIDHDYSWSVLKHIPNGIGSGNILGASGKIEIGNNVFIGVGSTILRNVKIGNNVIIGANSLVSKDCLDNGVYAGNPAKFIMSIDDYYNKRENFQFEEAKILVQQYKQKFGVFPREEILYEYFMLFRKDDILDKFKNTLDLTGNGFESRKYLKNHVPMFASYEDFLKSCDCEE